LICSSAKKGNQELGEEQRQRRAGHRAEESRPSLIHDERTYRAATWSIASHQLTPA
jgi:hypothetical protein